MLKKTLYITTNYLIRDSSFHNCCHFLSRMCVFATVTWISVGSKHSHFARVQYFPVKSLFCCTIVSQKAAEADEPVKSKTE